MDMSLSFYLGGIGVTVVALLFILWYAKHQNQ